MVTRKASSGIETKEVLSAVVLADSFTQVRSLSSQLQVTVNCVLYRVMRLHLICTVWTIIKVDHCCVQF